MPGCRHCSTRSYNPRRVRAWQSAFLTFAGREDELGALLDLLDASGGLPAAAVVVGEAGIGKTALWLAAVEAAGRAAIWCSPAGRPKRKQLSRS